MMLGQAFITGSLLVLASMVMSVGAHHLSLTGKYFALCEAAPNTSIHDYDIRDVHGVKKMSVRDLTEGKVTLIVNVASFCHLTLQYYQLNALLEQFPPSQLAILGFPCNQFKHQEPGLNGTEILNCLEQVRPGNGFKLHPDIQLALRGEVNGLNEHPLYTYLKSSCPQPQLAYFRNTESYWDPIHLNDITWNFEKFLVNAEGVPILRIRPWVEPLELTGLIEVLQDWPNLGAVDHEKILAVLEEFDQRSHAQ